MKNDLISIIVPVYKVERYLSQCIDSIINQTYTNLEIILVDDGSPDNCGMICDEYARLDNRIKVIHKENGGLSSARNAGLDIATGEYIGFVDSDDYIDDLLVSETINIIKKENVDLVKFGYYKEGKHFKIKNNFVLPTNKPIDSTGEEVRNNIFKTDNLCTCWGNIYKANIAKKIMFDNSISVGEDFLYVTNYLTKCNKIYISDKHYYHYIINQNSLTHKFDMQKSIFKTSEAIKANIEVEKLIFGNIQNKNKPRLEKSKRNIFSFFDSCIENNNYKKFVEIINEFKNNDIINTELQNINNYSSKEEKLLNKDYKIFIYKKFRLFFKRLLRTVF